MRGFIAIIAFVNLFTTPLSVAAMPISPSVASMTSSIHGGSYCADLEELALLDQLNDYREENGQGPLALSATLGAAAKHHSESMATFNYFDGSHDLHFEGPDQDETVTWQQNIANHGYPDNTHTSRAENLAAGFETAAQTLDQWKNSPSHNAHMLNSKYQAIGIGRAFNPESEYRWYWTVTFGSLADSVAPACNEGSTDEAAMATGSPLPIVRSGRNGSSTESRFAYDGDLSTAWNTTKARTPTSGYVWFDLGDVRSVSRIEYFFSRTGGADAFNLQVSHDRDEWITIAELGYAEAGEWAAYEWSGEARYVRFHFTNPNGVETLGYLAEVRIIA